jgi:hypothetical protein
MAEGPVDYYCRKCGKPFSDARMRRDHEETCQGPEEGGDNAE